MARSFEQRRKLARRPCEIEVEVNLGRKGFMATVVDLGPGGLRLRFEQPMKLQPKTLLRVTYPDTLPKHDVMTVEGLVRWSQPRQSDQADFVGLEYKEQKALARSWVKAKMHDLGFSSYNLREQRTAHRVIAQLPGRLEVGETVRPCAVINLGLGGLYLELRQPLRAGALIDVRLDASPRFPGTTFRAMVRHQQQMDPGDPFGYGCSFPQLSAEQVEALEAFLIAQHQENWERLEPWPELLASLSTGPAADEVEIPDLASILADEEADPSESP